ncbi:hypothetical protein ACIQW5_25610 [Methylorubrum thiocyanatum]|jgi:hypothetical protein|uniref:hypothetical protein n=1 Tax=Methylorubrum thiocyanatum TaxID=47958 RepID=UPI00383B70D4
MRRVVLVPLLLLAAPALAEDRPPAYVGKWAVIADKTCAEPLLITEQTMEAIGDDSWQCQLPALAPTALSWSVPMKCAMEGTDYTQTQSWKLTGETLRDQCLTIQTKTGPVTYRRCSLSKRGAARRS